MDESRFDSMTRALSRSRRGTVKALLGGALGAMFIGKRDEEAEAGCKKAGKKCDKNRDCCDGAKCKGGKNGKCRCKSGLTSCSGEKACQNLDNNAEHCGACGNACAVDETCCDGVCADLQKDRANCGDCGVACGGPESCSSGTCLLCLPAAPLCGDTCCSTANCCGGVCVDLTTSQANCGSCFNLCDPDEACLGGVCKTPPA